MQKPDFELYGWLTGLAFVGHLASFMFLQPQPGANDTPKPFPWRRFALSLPLCLCMGLAGATFGVWLGTHLGWSGDNIAMARDCMCALFGYGGTAIISAFVQAIIDRLKILGGGAK